MQLPSWLKTTWRILRWLLLAILLLAMTLIAALWWANRHDDPLRPEVAALLKFEPPSPEAMRGNGYFIMLGLGAPDGEDAFEAGKRFFAVQLKEYEQLQRTRHHRSYADEAPKHLSIDIALVRCPPEADDCYAHYLKHADEIRAATAKYAVVVERYLSLLDAPEYVEVPVPSYLVPWPHYADWTAVSELVVIQAALLLNGPHQTEGLALLARNAQIHQRLMSGSRSLIGAMVALESQMRQRRLVSSALRHVPRLAVDNHDSTFALSAAPVNLSAPMKEELAQMLIHYNDPMLSNPFDDPDGLPWSDRLARYAIQALERLSYLPHATANAAYEDRKVSIALAKLPADQLAAQVEAAQSVVEARRQSRGLSLRNPVGDAVRGVVTMDLLVTYIQRAHDVEAHRRLVQLQIKALKERVPLAQMPTWLAAQPPELRNPYTLQPMGWDAATQALVFEGRQPNTQNPEPRNLFRVPIGPVATAAH